MLGWIVRSVMAVAGLITGWFVAREAASFGLIQMAVSLLLVTLFVALAAFWPSVVRLFKSGHEPEDRTKS